MAGHQTARRHTAVTYSQDGTTLYAGALDGSRAVLYRSTDNGTTWTPTS